MGKSYSDTALLIDTIALGIIMALLLLLNAYIVILHIQHRRKRYDEGFQRLKVFMDANRYSAVIDLYDMDITDGVVEFQQELELSGSGDGGQFIDRLLSNVNMDGTLVDSERVRVLLNGEKRRELMAEERKNARR